MDRLRQKSRRAEGPPPPVDLEHEKRTGDFVRKLIRSGRATACHDLSDGGLAVALAEMAMASGTGANIETPGEWDQIPVFFGEDQGRYLVTLPFDDTLLIAAIDEARALDIRVPCIGRTGGTSLKLGNARAIPVSDLKRAHETWFPAFMDG